MSGRIITLSGPTVRTDCRGLRLYERTAVGERRAIGEVVRLETGGAVLQVYEDTRGLAAGETVRGLGQSLAVTLGPGLLSTMYDGLQRPLEAMATDTGPFLRASGHCPALDSDRQWRFIPDRRQGHRVAPNEPLGRIEEGPFQHPVLVPAGVNGRIESIADGMVPLAEPVCRLTDGTEIPALHEWPVRVPRPYRRKLPADRPLVTGQRLIDFLFPLALGGTTIIPGGFGTGKTILEQTIAKFAAVDIVIYAGCGERGNEMSELIEEFRRLSDPTTGRPLMERTVLVVNTSNMPVAAREASIYTAVTLGEYYRDLGFDVLLLADSISRWAEALREISSSLEEMPGEEGYPTYLASRLAAFTERAGAVETLSGGNGSLSMILSVSPPGGDFSEPVTQALLRTGTTLLMLDSGLANARQFPAVNWNQSYSLQENILARYFESTAGEEWSRLRDLCRRILRREAALKEVVEIVGMAGLQEEDRRLMQTAVEIRQRFLAQNAFTRDAYCPPTEALALIAGILSSGDETTAEDGEDDETG